MYKNIIFDFGGVVVNFNPRDFLMDHFMNRRAEEETYDIVFGSQEWQDLDRGIITREEANKIMLEKAAHANRVFEVQTCLDEWFTMLETNKTTVQIMRKLKAAILRSWEQKLLQSAVSCESILSGVLRVTKSTPAPSAIAPGVFMVPLSNLSGRKSGCSTLSLALPVPPSMKVFSGYFPSVSISPVPIGPYRPLCPAVQMMFIPSFRLSGRSPAP